jgi:hypothetical protein
VSNVNGIEQQHKGPGGRKRIKEIKRLMLWGILLIPADAAVRSQGDVSF